MSTSFATEVKPLVDLSTDWLTLTGVGCLFILMLVLTAVLIKLILCGSDTAQKVMARLAEPPPLPEPIKSAKSPNPPPPAPAAQADPLPPPVPSEIPPPAVREVEEVKEGFACPACGNWVASDPVRTDIKDDGAKPVWQCEHCQKELISN